MCISTESKSERICKSLKTLIFFPQPQYINIELDQLISEVSC